MLIMPQFVDIAGSPLDVGDRVAFALAGYTNPYADKIVGFTAQQVRISVASDNPDYDDYWVLRRPCHVVKLPKTERQ